MTPSSAKQAGRVATLLATKQFNSIANSTKRRRIARARMIAETIWKRWSVGVYQWQLKHVRWFLVCATREMSPSTRYLYWVDTRAMLVLLKKERWIGSLQGSWRWPNPENAALDGRNRRPLL